MRTLIAEDVAEVFWDADEYYLKDKKQEAGSIYDNINSGRNSKIVNLTGFAQN